MRYIELSIGELEERSKELAEIVAKDYQPDVIVFIAKGSFLIGVEISKYFKAPLVECFAVRKGNDFKKILAPILRILPSKIKAYLRSRELKSGLHSMHKERDVYIQNQLDIIKNSKNILVVDDSVDTGNTVKKVVGYLRNFNKENIKIATLNYFLKSESVYQVDYSLYSDCIMVGPWSKDSKYYKEFIRRYKEVQSEGGI